MNWQHGVTKFLLHLICFSGLLLSSTGTRAGSSTNRLPKQRELAGEELFLLYEPLTTVTDDAAIDLDQKVMEEELAKGTPEGHAAALNIYQKGAFSKSYADLTLPKQDEGLGGYRRLSSSVGGTRTRKLAPHGELPVSLAKDTPIYGTTSDGTEVRGMLLEDTEKGAKTLKFRYHASSVQSEWTNCHVGGNPNPNTEGCLSPDGKIDIDDLGIYDYEYDVLNDNHNDRSLQGLSTKAESKMYTCDAGCPYPTYDKFAKYYGVTDYGDEFIQTAFANTSTAFLNGNANFGLLKTKLAQVEAISKGTIYLNLWMYIIKEMEHASSLCQEQQQLQCPAHDAVGPVPEECVNEPMLHSWDKAVAFYVGSAAKVDGTGTDGYLLYSMAQKRCLNFGTCLQAGAGKGMATVNFEMLMAFRQGQQSLRGRDCDLVKREVEMLTSLMTIPIIQGVLRYAYRSDKSVQPLGSDIQEKEQAEGATYAAALLPLLHDCNETEASIVYEEMKVGKVGPPNYEVVRAALERNYMCLKATCESIGGLVDAVKTEEYMPGAEPCRSQHSTGTSPTTESSPNTGNTATSASGTTSTTATKANTDTGPNVGLAVGLSVFFVALLLGISVGLGRKSGSKEQEFVISDSVEMT